ncbi:MAG: hypothetical protein K2V38_17240 [Gemmataceae bacterium]|nr:hypothetical protein [Gemmataceae bacterium]
MAEEENAIRFRVGTVVVTQGATEEQIAALLRQHQAGDWGDVGAEDAKANERALRRGEQVPSSSRVNGEKVWILTPADRSATTVLIPGES